LRQRLRRQFRLATAIARFAPGRSRSQRGWTATAAGRNTAPVQSSGATDTGQPGAR
jgi:hypothetical protein